MHGSSEPWGPGFTFGNPDKSLCSTPRPPETVLGLSPGVCGHHGQAEGPAGTKSTAMKQWKPRFHSLPPAPTLPSLPPAHHFAHPSSTPTTPKAVSSAERGCCLPPLPFQRARFSPVEFGTLGYASPSGQTPPSGGEETLAESMARCLLGNSTSLHT